MKRELDSAMKSFSDASSSACPTQASSGLVQIDDGISCKRVKVTQVNGYIVYTRVKKREINVCNGLLGALQKKRFNELEDGFIVDTVVEESSTVDETDIVGRLFVESISMVDGQVDECDFEKSQSGERRGSETLISSGLASQPGSPLAEEGDNIPVKASSRFRRLSLRTIVEPEESFSYELQTVESGSNLNFGMGADVDGESMVPRKNLELKMSKKIAINKCPMTVKELFDTGLLDGVTVVYMGTINSKVD